MLSAGTRLGPYEILSPLGAGGMGEVYRARDTKLHRDVALKILPDAFAADPDRLARFHRESQTLAALNHPNIAHVHGLEEGPAAPGAPPIQALVMELVEGEDLSARIARGPVPIDEAIGIAKQVAEALEAAHEQGTIHRDLKPANIKVRADGTVKLLDFGLAKAMEAGAGPSRAFSPAGLATAPTLTTPAVTAAGVILGTAAYMSPEQARGKPVDKRTDIWAFGVVLYEMLTGRTAFPGDTVTDVLASVVSHDPDWTALPSGVPGLVRLVLTRCLEKEQRLRLRDIGEARVFLSGELSDPHAQDAPSSPTRPGPAGFRRILPWAVAILAVVAAAGVRLLPRPPTAPPLRRIEMALPKPTATRFELSPDGTQVAFLADGHLRVMAFDRVDSRDLGPWQPPPQQVVVWSPDSSFLAYATADGKLRKVPAGGGPPLVVCDIPESGRLMGAAWRPDGVIVLAVWRSHLYEVPAAGGRPALLLAANPDTEIDLHRLVLARGGRLLVTTHLRPFDPQRPTDPFRIEMLDGSRRTTVLEGDLQLIAYVDPGYLLVARYGANAGLWALPFSDRLPLRIDDAFLVVAGASIVTAGRDGTLLYLLPSNAPATRDLVWVDRAGRIVGSIGATQVAVGPPALSADGRRIAFAARIAESADIWVRDLQRNVQSRITFEGGDEGMPDWSPSGDRLVYSEFGPAMNPTIAISNADGSGGRRALVEGMSPLLSQDGRYLVYLQDDRGAQRVRYAALSSDGSVGPSERLFKAVPEPDVTGLRLSPKGDFLAYAARQPSGEFEVFVTRFPSGEGSWQISTGGGRSPRWARDTGELVFLGGTAGGAKHLVSVPVTLHPILQTGAPATLFDLSADLGLALFDVTADGKRFAMVRSREEAGSTSRLIFVQNWPAELKGHR